MNDEERHQRIRTLLKKFTWNDDPVNMATVTAETTLLHYATSAGDMEAVNLLVEINEDVDAIGNIGNTPLHRAAQEGHFDIYDYLVAHGASENTVNEFGNTPRQYREAFKDKEDAVLKGDVNDK